MAEPENAMTQEEKKKFDRKEYMRQYMKKRYYDKPEETKKFLKNKAKRYREKTQGMQNPEEYGLDQRDVQLLRTYYKKVLLLRPDAIQDVLIELGVPEMAPF
jgi:hypothetical protein